MEVFNAKWNGTERSFDSYAAAREFAMELVLAGAALVEVWSVAPWGSHLISTATMGVRSTSLATAA